jgi:general secretion pathway protein M
VQDKLREALSKLGQRDRLVLTAGMVLVAAILVIQLTLVPYIEARSKLTKSLRANEKILKEMIVLGSEYRALSKGMNEIRTGMNRRAPNFTLFSHLERKAGETGVRKNIQHMQPSRSASAGSYEEVSVEIKLEKITLKELVNFLYAVESPEEMVRVKRMSVKKAAEAPQYLSALIQVATFEAARGEAIPAGRS